MLKFIRHATATFVYFCEDIVYGYNHARMVRLAAESVLKSYNENKDGMLEENEKVMSESYTP